MSNLQCSIIFHLPLALFSPIAVNILVWSTANSYCTIQGPEETNGEYYYAKLKFLVKYIH